MHITEPRSMGRSTSAAAAMTPPATTSATPPAAAVMLRTLASGALALAAFSAQALSFAEAFDAARSHDARYRAAGQELAVAQQEVPIARAGLLPVLAISASDSKVLGTRALPNNLNQEMRLRLDYTAPQMSLNLRVPLINGEAVSRYRQAQVQSELADSAYRAQGLDLVDRLATAYLQVLIAEEGLRLTEAQQLAQGSQFQQAQQRLQRGEGTRQEEALTRAALDLTRARRLDAIDQVELARRQLQRITGLQRSLLRQIPDAFAPAPLWPERLGDWLDLAYLNSAVLRARELRVVVARLGVKRQASGHLPRLDLVASLSRNENESINSLNQATTLRTVGVQLNVPIYSGGVVDASVKQAMAEQARAEEEVRLEKENIAVEVQRFHQTALTGAPRIAANVQAVASAELALYAAERSISAGLGTLNDVSEAQTRLFLARRDLTQARIDYLSARLRLMLQTGMAMAEVSADLDAALLATPDALAYPVIEKR